VRYEVTVETTAAPAAVWALLADVTHWPDWTPTVTSVTALGDGPLRVGSRYKVRQPGILPAVWEVTGCAEDASFVWASSSPGSRLVAGHEVRPNEAGGTTVVLSIDHTGALAGVIDAVLGKKIRRYVETEAASLAAASAR
jgi:uncharacterized membrane protein